jgi:hypothetical protein
MLGEQKRCKYTVTLAKALIVAKASGLFHALHSVVQKATCTLHAARALCARIPEVDCIYHGRLSDRRPLERFNPVLLKVRLAIERLLNLLDKQVIHKCLSRYLMLLLTEQQGSQMSQVPV